MRIIAVIPARYSSTRLPGKPLVEIKGKPMLWWVYQHAKEVHGLNHVLVATDDNRILAVCHKYKMSATMTRSDHPTAIHRLHEVAQNFEADIYLQINGDEPLLSHEIIQTFVDFILNKENFPIDSACGINAITPVHEAAEVIDPTNIKMLFDKYQRCIYMSRAPLPFPYNALDYTYYKHVGLIGYTKKMLQFYVDTAPGNIERAEGIDLLRFIEYAKTLYLCKVENIDSLSVDTEKDLIEVKTRMKESTSKL